MTDPRKLRKKQEKALMEALTDLTAHAMAAGAASFVDRARRGEIDPSGTVYDAFDPSSFPAEFLSVRSSLVEAVRRAVEL